MNARSILAALIVGIFTCGPGIAAPLKNSPVQYQETGVWYELAAAPPGQGNGYLGQVPWSKARAIAAQRSWNGIQGRLAIIDNPALNYFLRDTFQPRGPTWIGLRYHCSAGRLVWVNGRSHTRANYNNWSQEWRGGLACNPGHPFAPVYVNSPQQGFVWKAQGIHKKYLTFFVEYSPDARYEFAGEKR